MENLYDSSFYGEQFLGSSNSAAAVVPTVCDIFDPHSVVDLGCGVGTWLNEFIKHGVEHTLGADGDYVSRDMLIIPPDNFRSVDLTSEIAFDTRYDLALCLEVGEHLPGECASTLVRSLSNASDTILFSAAIPYQGGVGHINCRWQSWWAEMFSHEGFRPFDLLRQQFWNDDRVEPWYRQNMIVYARGESADIARETQHAALPLDIVHPAELERGMLGVPRIGHVLDDLKLAMSRRIRTVMGNGADVRRNRQRFSLPD